MLRYMIHATVIAADVTTQVAISDHREGWLMAVTLGTMLISALSLARDCSARLFSPPRPETFDAG